MTAEVADYPKRHRDLVISAIDEIDHFLDTKVYNDGIAILAIAEYLDGDPNPINVDMRARILENIGLTKEGRYIAQTLALLKTNKSWHSSEVPNQCTYFGDICTTRGTADVDGKRGRKSTRSPDDYHVLKTNGTINREQLITPSLDALHRAIPADNLTSARSKDKNIIRLDKIDDLEPEELARILDTIKAAEKRKNDVAV
jgi:hypothetical protein